MFMDAIGDLFWPFVALIHFGVGMALHEAGVPAATAVQIVCVVSFVFMWYIKLIEPSFKNIPGLIMYVAYCWVLFSSSLIRFGVETLTSIIGVGVFILIASLMTFVWCMLSYPEDEN
jgi:hypothetical protein